MAEKNFQQAVGFSVKDTLALYWLHETAKEPCYSVEIYERFIENFPGRKVGYEYVARVAKQLEAEAILTSSLQQRKVYYDITDQGRQRLIRYEELYYERFHEIVTVLNRFYFELTRNGEKPPKPNHALPEEFRAYFSKLISVKDAVRYIAFKLGQKRTVFSMADVAAQLEDLFGWSPSNSYLYTISSELEEKGYLIGEWPDEKRTKRHLKSTDAATEFQQQIATDLTAQITANRRFLTYMLQFLRQPQ
ncbi:hypothetical protein [Kurthia sibirica]|uniref:Transcription regulator PadR N-terminal domain-containing protein n=1 Tax=Kurthia sibirica TaxID=202750 RepID=A0A2U3AN09_9BACL|nr:hypothetical protein [Kurthia sibirica]PWI25924.1 hypothetical protein DEX24_05170 [Kurthia sibirica]GEK34280.1 hypothetical protein KSI01_18130 [Kurthia sibirica]